MNITGQNLTFALLSDFFSPSSHIYQTSNFVTVSTEASTKSKHLHIWMYHPNE